MPAVDPGTVQRARYHRQRMNVISRAINTVGNIVFTFYPTLSSNVVVAESTGASFFL